MLLLASVGCRTTHPVAQQEIKLQTETAGLHRLSLRDMQQAGLSIDQLAPNRVGLTHQGAHVPFFVADDALYFYAPPANSRYHTSQTFWLTANEQGMEMKTAVSPQATPTTPQIQHTIEQNNIYEARAATAVFEPWFWVRVDYGQQSEVAFQFPHQPQGDARLTVPLWGLTHHTEIAPDHAVDLYLNDAFVKTAVWDGQTAHAAQVDLPAGLLKQGDNMLRLDNRDGDVVDIFLLDSITIEADALPDAAAQSVLLGNGGAVVLSEREERPFLIDITNPSQPVQIKNGGTAVGQHYLLATPDSIPQPTILQSYKDDALLAPAQGADLLLVLADGGWKTAVQPLIDQREAEGLRVKTVTIDALYDTFNNGQPSPEAITKFLQHTTAHWPPPAPRFVLLVGDGSADFAGYANRTDAKMIPPLLTPVTFGGETVSDARLGELNAQAGVDIAIGRWPVHSRRELVGLVEKTVAGEIGVAETAVRAIIDPSDPSFAAFANRLALEAIDKPNPAITAYIGHGSLQQWGTTNLQTSLSTQASSPLLLQFTCLTGLFAHPTQPSLSEQLLLADNQTTHIIAATSLTLSYHQEPFATVLLDALTSGNHQHVGSAFLAAQQSLDLTLPQQREIHDTFLLFGDPSAPLTNAPKQ